jgi:hypothetical protein
MIAYDGLQVVIFAQIRANVADKRKVT